MKKCQPNILHLKTRLKISFIEKKLSEMHSQHYNNIALLLNEVKIRIV